MITVTKSTVVKGGDCNACTVDRHPDDLIYVLKFMRSTKSNMSQRIRVCGTCFDELVAYHPSGNDDGST